MHKLIFGAKRKPGMSREEFGRDWTTVHGEKAKKVPGISRRQRPGGRVRECLRF